MFVLVCLLFGGVGTREEGGGGVLNSGVGFAGRVSWGRGGALSLVRFALFLHARASAFAALAACIILFVRHAMLCSQKFQFARSVCLVSTMLILFLR